MAEIGARWIIGTLLSTLLGTLLAVHAYVELTDPATATNAFSAGISGVIQGNTTLRAQYQALQAAAAASPDQSFVVPGLGIQLSGAQLQQLSYEQVADMAGEQIGQSLYFDGASAARNLIESTDTSASPELQRTSAEIADKLDSVELGLGVVSNETNDIAETIRYILILATIACGIALFVVATGPARLTSPGIATLTAAAPFALVFFFASRWFGPQENVGLTENVRESLAPTIDGLFNTYLYVSVAGIFLLVLGLVWTVFIRTGQFGLDAPPARREPAPPPVYSNPAAYRPRPAARPAYNHPEPFFEDPGIAPAQARRRPAPWSSAPPPPPPSYSPPAPPAPAPEAPRAGPFGELLSRPEEAE
ncbi:MAG: hypothetical protein WEB00_12055 [Dehalococcoidia bacterium]